MTTPSPVLRLSCAPSAQIPSAVLDTNIVLDWLVFSNPGCRAIGLAIEMGALRWVATPAMRNELAHVLGRALFKARSPNEAALWNTWDTLAHTVDPPVPTGSALRVRCTDPDDQKFVELALAGTQWLFSRDRAVLKLARRTLPLGVKFCVPEAWTPA